MGLFRISKISTFESNSQHKRGGNRPIVCCSEYQRYQLLRAIHNMYQMAHYLPLVVPNIKDINFWEQFTTGETITIKRIQLFRISKISTFESNSQQNVYDFENASCCSEYQRYQLLRAIHNTITTQCLRGCVVPNIKDINFWEQFTTMQSPAPKLLSCSEYQRYQLLRAIHN